MRHFASGAVACRYMSPANLDSSHRVGASPLLEQGRDGQMMLENFSGDVGAAGSLIASVSRGDGNGAAITAATFLIPIRMPGAKIVGEVGVEIAGSATREAGRRSNEILKQWRPRPLTRS